MNDVLNLIIYGRPEPRGSKVSIPSYEDILDASGNKIKHPTTGKPRRRVRMDPKTDRAIIFTVDDNKKSGPWMKKVQRAAVAAMAGREVFTGPVKLTQDFYVERPLAHFGTGKNAGILKERFARAKPITKPDRLKLARAIEDACTNIVYRDDAQIIDGPVRKHYCGVGELPRVEIQIEFAAVVATVQKSLLA